MVQDEVFQLEPENCIPAVELLHCSQGEAAVLDRFQIRLNIAQKESCVIVAKPVADGLGGTARGGVEAAFCSRKPGRVELFEALGQMAVVRKSGLGRNLRGRLRSVNKSGENSPFFGRLGPEDVRKDFVEVAFQDALREKAHPAQVLVGGKTGIDSFEVFRDAARDRQDVEDFARGDARCRLSPEADAIRERKFPDHHVQRPASHEARVLEDVVRDPGRNGTAEHHHETVVLLEGPIPDDLQVARKAPVVLSHPGDFVQQHHRLAPVDPFVELVERLEPGAEGRDFASRLLGQLFPEGIELVAVGHSGFRCLAFQREESCAAPSGEFRDEGAFSDPSPSAARDQGRHGLAPQRGQGFQFVFTTDEHEGLLSFRRRAILPQNESHCKKKSGERLSILQSFARSVMSRARPRGRGGRGRCGRSRGCARRRGTRGTGRVWRRGRGRGRPRRASRRSRPRGRAGRASGGRARGGRRQHAPQRRQRKEERSG